MLHIRLGRFHFVVSVLFSLMYILVVATLALRHYQNGNLQEAQLKQQKLFAEDSLGKSMPVTIHPISHQIGVKVFLTRRGAILDFWRVSRRRINGGNGITMDTGRMICVLCVSFCLQQHEIFSRHFSNDK